MSDVVRIEQPTSLRGRLREIAATYGWSLCIGAGTSIGVFGGWQELAKSLLEQAGYPNNLITELACSYSSEALIQTAFNAKLSNTREYSEESFVDLLSEELYKQFKTRCGDRWPAIARALSTLDPGGLTRAERRKFRDQVENAEHPSALPLAESIAQVLRTDVGPASILSFNVEPLLFALVNCYWQMRSRGRADDSRPLDRIIHDISQRHKARIPYYFVHGLLPVPNGKCGFNKILSRDKLVFSEGQYLQLSKSIYTWQSATFLSECTQHRLVFFGVSFSDPNLRRWLAWDHAGRTSERQRKGYPTDRLQHYWIRTVPDDDSEEKRRLIQQSVAHLGVRIIWMSAWNDIGKTLTHLLARKKTKRR